MTQLLDSEALGRSSNHVSGVRPRPDGARAARRIVIVGHGMVGQRLCEEIRARPSLRQASVTVFGEEPHPAYDRVHLRRILRGERASALELTKPVWYEDNDVKVVREDPVVRIHREDATVETSSGHFEPYDQLILATGAAPVYGKVPGMPGRDVCALRTIADAEQIRTRAVAAAQTGLPVVIVGAGLLGLELADELSELNISVHVLEAADFPLSRQLEKSAGEKLRSLLATHPLKLCTRVRITQVEETEHGSYVHLGSGERILTGLIVPAMGIRPRDQLARDAGLSCDLFGGILVGDDLGTRDPKIFAVGECARHRGMTYGLVAPGYAMAEVVAKHLSGSAAKFKGVQTGTRLKFSSVELTVVGESSATGLGMREHTYQSDTSYRRIATKRGRVIGVTSLGPWKELPRVQEAMARAEKLRPIQLKRFEAAEDMWRAPKLSLMAWPESATVCTCMGVTCGALKRAKFEGCANVEALMSRTGAGTVCGSCQPLLATLTEEHSEEKEASPWMLRLSLLSVVGALAYFVLPEIPYADSVRTKGIDVLWRTETYKQITGFTLAGLFSLSLLFSMRKRLAWFRFADFEAWRVTHAFLGLLGLVGGFMHTGFRLGQGLDLGLISVFLGSTLLGGVAGGFSLLESRLSPERARTLRGLLIRSHIYLLWPLPVLLAAHVLKVYYF